MRRCSPKLACACWLPPRALSFGLGTWQWPRSPSSRVVPWLWASDTGTLPHLLWDLDDDCIGEVQPNPGSQTGGMEEGHPWAASWDRGCVKPWLPRAPVDVSPHVGLLPWIWHFRTSQDHRAYLWNALILDDTHTHPKAEELCLQRNCRNGEGGKSCNSSRSRGRLVNLGEQHLDDHHELPAPSHSSFELPQASFEKTFVLGRLQNGARPPVNGACCRYGWPSTTSMAQHRLFKMKRLARKYILRGQGMQLAKRGWTWPGYDLPTWPTVRSQTQGQLPPPIYCWTSGAR